MIGCLDDPYKAMFVHRDEVQVASRLTAAAFDDRHRDVADLQLVDVRNPGEVADGSDRRARSRSRSASSRHECRELDPHRPTVVYCAGGYRSSVAASVLRQRGFADVSDIIGGYNAYAEASRTTS